MEKLFNIKSTDDPVKAWKEAIAEAERLANEALQGVDERDPFALSLRISENYSKVLTTLNGVLNAYASNGSQVLPVMREFSQETDRAKRIYKIFNKEDVDIFERAMVNLKFNFEQLSKFMTLISSVFVYTHEAEADDLLYKYKDDDKFVVADFKKELNAWQGRIINECADLNLGLGVFEKNFNDVAAQFLNLHLDKIAADAEKNLKDFVDQVAKDMAEKQAEIDAKVEAMKITAGVGYGVGALFLTFGIGAFIAIGTSIALAALKAELDELEKQLGGLMDEAHFLQFVKVKVDSIVAKLKIMHQINSGITLAARCLKGISQYQQEAFASLKQTIQTDMDLQTQLGFTAQKGRRFINKLSEKLQTADDLIGHTRVNLSTVVPNFIFTSSMAPTIIPKFKLQSVGIEFPQDFKPMLFIQRKRAEPRALRAAAGPPSHTEVYQQILNRCALLVYMSSALDNKPYTVLEYLSVKNKINSQVLAYDKLFSEFRISLYPFYEMFKDEPQELQTVQFIKNEYLRPIVRALGQSKDKWLELLRPNIFGIISNNLDQVEAELKADFDDKEANYKFATELVDKHLEKLKAELAAKVRASTAKAFLDAGKFILEKTSEVLGNADQLAAAPELAIAQQGSAILGQSIEQAQKIFGNLTQEIKDAYEAFNKDETLQKLLKQQAAAWSSFMKIYSGYNLFKSVKDSVDLPQLKADLERLFTLMLEQVQFWIAQFDTLDKTYAGLLVDGKFDADAASKAFIKTYDTVDDAYKNFKWSYMRNIMVVSEYGTLGKVSFRGKDIYDQV